MSGTLTESMAQKVALTISSAEFEKDEVTATSVTVRDGVVEPVVVADFEDGSMEMYPTESIENISLVER